MPERMAYAIDDSRWPLLVARATEFMHDPADFEASYRKLESILARNQPFLLVFDVRGASSTSSRRRKFMEWCQHHADVLTRNLIAAAVIAASSVERGFVTATLWVKSPPFPMRVFAESSDAEEWLLTNFRHLTLPSAR